MRSEIRVVLGIGIKIRPETQKTGGIHRVVEKDTEGETARRRECDWHLSQSVAHGVILGEKASSLLPFLPGNLAHRIIASGLSRPRGLSPPDTRTSRPTGPSLSVGS